MQLVTKLVLGVSSVDWVHANVMTSEEYHFRPGSLAAWRLEVVARAVDDRVDYSGSPLCVRPVLYRGLFLSAGSLLGVPLIMKLPNPATHAWVTAGGYRSLATPRRFYWKELPPCP